MAIANVSLQVTALTWLTPAVAEFDLNNNVSNNLPEFLPGQFVSILVGKAVRRSYSIANYKGQNQSLKLLIDIAPGGPGSKFFEALKVGDEVPMLGPLGRFIYKPNNTPLEFFATGTGLAPLYSMLENELYVVKSGRQIRLHFGVRHVDDVFWRDKLEALKLEFPNFAFDLYLSRPNEEWEGKGGYINQPDVIKTISKDADCYICGGSRMINDTLAKLREHGLDLKQLFFERYY